MLKHVEQAVALYALRWFQKYELGLAAMYEPHVQVDAQFRGRLDLLRKRAHDYERAVATEDPDAWDAETALGAFQATLMLKDAMDAAGPLLLKRAHGVLAAQALAAGRPVVDPRELFNQTQVPRVDHREKPGPARQAPPFMRTPRRSERQKRAARARRKR